MPSVLLRPNVRGKRRLIPAAVATAALLFVLPFTLPAQQRVPQREQVEQIEARNPSLDASMAGRQPGQVPPSESVSPDDAFGAQSILRARPRKSVFQASVENGVFYTDNAALLRSDKQDAVFLNTSLSLGWRTAISNRVTAGITGRYGLFRYDRLSVLDFQSLDIDAFLVVILPAKVELLTGYGFTQYTARHDAEEFYTEHVLNVGLQRVFELSRVHSIALGIAARWSWAEEELAQRDRYSAYVGYHLRATDRLSADLSYRYAFFDYRDGGTGRGDHNHSLSLSVRYDVTDWMNIIATVQGTWNRSNQSVFNYDALNVGGSLGLNARF